MSTQLRLSFLSQPNDQTWRIRIGRATSLIRKHVASGELNGIDVTDVRSISEIDLVCATACAVLHGSSEVSLAAIPQLLTQGVCCLQVSGASFDATLSDAVTRTGYYRFECADFGSASLRRWLLTWQRTGFASTAFEESCDSLACLPDECFILADIASAVNIAEDEVIRLNSSNKTSPLHAITSANCAIAKALALINSLTRWDPLDIDVNHCVDTRAILDRAKVGLQELQSCLLELTPEHITSTRITTIRQELDALSLQIRGMHQVYSSFSSFQHRFGQVLAIATAWADMAQVRDKFRPKLATVIVETAPRLLEAIKSFSQQLAEMNERIHRSFVPACRRIESLLEARSILGDRAAGGETDALANLPGEAQRNNAAIVEELIQFREWLRRAA